MPSALGVPVCEFNHLPRGSVQVSVDPIVGFVEPYLAVAFEPPARHSRCRHLVVRVRREVIRRSDKAVNVLFVS